MNITSDRHREPDWSAWNRWCDSRIDAKRSFDREVLIELVADLKGMIEDRDEKLKAQTENIHNLELKLAELVGAEDGRPSTDTSASNWPSSRTLLPNCNTP